MALFFALNNFRAPLWRNDFFLHFNMEIYLVPFSLLDLVCLSPLYAYVVWYVFRKYLKKRVRFTGFFSWCFIIHAAIIPIFWILHSIGLFHAFESAHTGFDPVAITGHIGAFFTVYILFTGGITLAILALVKKNTSAHY